MSGKLGPKIVRDGLILHYDASDTGSYPATGTKWYNLASNAYHLDITTGIWVPSGARSYMDMDNGCGKYIVGGTLTNLPWYANATVCVFTMFKTASTDWRTLIRGSPTDHQILVQNPVSLGMYSNTISPNFFDSGFDMDTIPNYGTRFNFMAWKLANSSPYYQFFYNENLETAAATLTSAGSSFVSGFSSIGAFHNNLTSTASYSQNWGKIAVFLYYNRHLSSSELTQNYDALKTRFA